MVLMRDVITGGIITRLFAIFTQSSVPRTPVHLQEKQVKIY